MDFQLLGPVGFRVGGSHVELGPARQRCVLAVLLERAGREVPTASLVDRVWGENPPDGVRNSLYSYVTRLRRVLRANGVELRRTGHGYILDISPECVDLHRFTALATRPERLADALAEWRGEPLAGLSGDWVEQVRTRLHRQHIGMLAEWAAQTRRTGDPGVVIERLGAALDTYPYAENLIALFLWALHAAGRTSEALEYFEACRARLRADLGVLPSAELTEVHQELLHGALPAEPARRSTPAQLPPRPRGFTGRVAELAELDELLGGAGENPAFVVVSGFGGVGKTALAATWAHRIAERFPDGQLFVNLRGYAQGEPMHPVEALSAFLRALGVAPDQIPLDVDAASALYRTLMARRRALVLLDNAAGAAHVRPLLPGTTGSFVLITSRDRLSGLVADAGARRIVLGPLSRDESVAVLCDSVGLGRIGDDPTGAAELAALCGDVPLALRIAAANLVEDPERGVGGYARELRERNPIEVLETGDSSVALRAAFDSSYQRLSEDRQRVFRLLGLHPGPDFTAETAAVLAGVDHGDARRVLRSLAAANLVEQDGGRFAFHDLLRQYAAERAHRDEAPADRAAAEDRLADYYLRTADNAGAKAAWIAPRLAVPVGPARPRTFPDRETASAWLDAEVENLVAFAESAERAGRPALAWLVCDVLRGYFRQRSHHLAWQTVIHAGLAAARRHGDLLARTMAQISLGYFHRVRGMNEDALVSLTDALTLSRQADWCAAEAEVLNQLGVVYHKLARSEESIDCLRHATKLARTAAEPDIEHMTVGNLGNVLYQLGSLREALRHHRSGVAVLSSLDNKFRSCHAYTNVGLDLLELGDIDEAVAQLELGLDLARQIGDHVNEANCRGNLASAHLVAGRVAEAREQAELALTLATRTETRGVAAEAVSVLAACAEQHDEALTGHRKAVALAREAGDPHIYASVATRLAEQAGLVADLEFALDLNRRHDFRVLEARTLLAFADHTLAAGDLVAANEHASAALTLCRVTGHRPGENKALRIIAEIRGRADAT